jgi:hypothetical protein
MLEHADMTPAALLSQIQQHGGKIVLDGGDLALSAPQPLPTDLVQEVRLRKAELVAFLNAEAANTDPAERRRCEVLAMLEGSPRITHAFVTDEQAEPDYVILTVGIRGVGTWDLRIPREKYDGLAVLKLIRGAHGGCCTSAPGPLAI